MSEGLCQICGGAHSTGACQETRGSLSKREERERKIGLLKEKIKELDEQTKPLEEEIKREETKETWEDAQEIFDLLSKQLPKGKRVSVSVEDLPEFEVGGFCSDGYDATSVTIFSTGKKINQRRDYWLSDPKDKSTPPPMAINFEAMAGDSPLKFKYVRLSIEVDEKGRVVRITGEGGQKMEDGERLVDVYGVDEKGNRISARGYEKLSKEEKERIRPVEYSPFAKLAGCSYRSEKMERKQDVPDDDVARYIFNELFKSVREKFKIGLPVRGVFSEKEVEKHEYRVLNIGGGARDYRDERKPVKKEDGMEFVLKE